MISNTTMTAGSHRSSGGTIVPRPGILPLLGTILQAEARGGLCRLILRQRFHNPHHEPLSVTYSLPVPEDAAVSGFAFTIGDRRIVGEVDRKASARQRFEDAILEGRTAAILDEERSTVFSQEVGNIPPGADLDVEIEIDQRLKWLEEGQWELRVPTTIAPRYLGSEGRVPDARKVHQDVVDGDAGVKLSLALSVLDDLRGRFVASPSHRLVVERNGDGARVGFSEETAPLDRDVVVRWQASGQSVGAQLTMSDRKTVQGRVFGLLSLVPPEPTHSARLPRDVVLLLDTSGSMSGEPIAQAQRIASALVSSLSEQDTLEMIQFSWSAKRWRKKPERMDDRGRRDALVWIKKLSASGGTEMRDGILAALDGIHEHSQRQVVLVTDGLIGFEKEIVSTILNRLPRSSRVHTVGVGSGVNRTLTAGASRAGRGVEVVLGLGEDPEPAAWRLNARMNAPVVVDLEIEGSALVGYSPKRLPDLFQGAPACVALELRPAGGRLQIRGRTNHGAWSTTLDVAAGVDGSAAVAKLFGREYVNDLEMNIAAGERGDWETRIEEAGLAFQIATRLTSWVAIDSETSVDPEAPGRRQHVPQQLPHGMSAEGLGLRAPQSPQFALASAISAGPVPARRSASAKQEEVSVDFSMRTRWVPPVAPARPPAAPPPPGAPPPAARRPSVPEPPKRAKGAIHRATDALRSFFEDAESPEVSADELAAPMESGAIVRILPGRVVKHEDGSMVVSFTVTHEPLSWTRPEQVELVWNDGTRVLVTVKSGTRSTTAGVGTELRLVMELPSLPRSDAPAAIHVSTPEGVIAIEMEPA